VPDARNNTAVRERGKVIAELKGVKNLNAGKRRRRRFLAF